MTLTSRVVCQPLVVRDTRCVDDETRGFVLQHIGAGAMVIASFQQTLWTVQPVSSGAVRQKSLGTSRAASSRKFFKSHFWPPLYLASAVFVVTSTNFTQTKTCGRSGSDCGTWRRRVGFLLCNYRYNRGIWTLVAEMWSLVTQGA